MIPRDVMPAAVRCEDVYPLVRAALEELSPSAVEWRVPDPTWHNDLPEEDARRLRDSYFVADGDDLRRMHAEASGWPAS